MKKVFALLLSLALILSKTALGVTGIWCAWPIGWCTATVLSVLFYRQGRWEEAARGEGVRT